MTKISTFNNDESVGFTDRLLGTDISGQTKNYEVKDVVNLINSVAGKDYIQYQFSLINYGIAGSFTTNTSKLIPTEITKLYINKQSLSNADLTLLFDKIDTLQNIIVSFRNPSDSNNFVTFKITNITSNTNYFELDVVLYKVFYSGNFSDGTVYSLYFDVKENFEDKTDKGGFSGTAQDLNTDIQTRVVKETGKSLVLDTEIAKLSNLDNTTDLQKPISTLQSAAIAERLLAGGYVGTAEDLNNLITSSVTGVTGKSIVPTDTPSGTGIASWIALEAGTYTNFGGMVVNPSSIAVISRNASNIFSITQTLIVIPDNGIKIWTATTFQSGDQVNYLGKDWTANTSTLSSDIPGTSNKWDERLNAYLELKELNDIDVSNSLPLSSGLYHTKTSARQALLDIGANKLRQKITYVTALTDVFRLTLIKTTAPSNENIYINLDGVITTIPVSAGESYATTAVNIGAQSYIGWTAVRTLQYVDFTRIGIIGTSTPIFTNDLGGAGVTANITQTAYNTPEVVVNEEYIGASAETNWLLDNNWKSISLENYLTIENGLTTTPSPILKSCIVTGKPNGTYTWLNLRLIYNINGLVDSLLISDTLKFSFDFLTDDSNINGVAIYYITSAGNYYTGHIPTSIGNSHIDNDSGILTKNITGDFDIHIRVFYTDINLTSTFYTSNINLYSSNLRFNPNFFNFYVLTDFDLASSFFMESLAPMNKQVSISNDFDTQSFVKLNKWYKKKYNCLGDSITEVNAVGEVKYYEHLFAWNNLSRVRQYGLSGRCIGKKYAGDVDCMSTMYTTMDNDADLITVFGGINDTFSDYGIGVMGDTTNETFYGALDVLIKGLTTKYPTKTIAFFTPLQRENAVGINGRNLEDYANAVIAVCRKYSIPCLDLYHQGGFCPAIQGTTYSGDGVHPNNDGQLLIAKKIYSFLNNL